MGLPDRGSQRGHVLTGGRDTAKAGLGVGRREQGLCAGRGAECWASDPRHGGIPPLWADSLIQEVRGVQLIPS